MDLHDVTALKEIKVKDGVKLRPLARSDAPRIIEILHADPEIRNRVAVAKDIYNEVDVYKEISTYKEYSSVIRFSLLLDDRCIGLVNFWRLDDYLSKDHPEPNTYGFGYFLDPMERGNGLMSAAVAAIMRVARDNLTVEKFIAFCEDDNPASSSVLRKCGFTPTDEIIYFSDLDWHERLYIALEES